MEQEAKGIKQNSFHLQAGFRVRFQFCNSALKGAHPELRGCCDLMGGITQGLPEFSIFFNSFKSGACISFGQQPEGFVRIAEQGAHHNSGEWKGSDPTGGISQRAGHGR